MVETPFPKRRHVRNVGHDAVCRPGLTGSQVDPDVEGGRAMEVAPGVHRFGSRLVNWYVVVDGDEVTLLDTGFPRHWRELEPGLHSIGRRREDIRAVVITHSHVDHTGFAARLAADGTQVLVHPSDAVHGARRFPPMHLYLQPSSWGLLWEGLRDGMAFTRRIERTTAMQDGEVLDVPGRPRAVHLGGHTPGSTAIVLDQRSVAFTGDNLVTLDPYTRRDGPQLMLCGVQHDEAGARDALRKLAGQQCATVLPGHGEPWTKGMDAACEVALSRHAALHP
jgi:glyoxylase-like metal-dependent hydrolase (beta-lactamase superfamily II)